MQESDTLSRELTIDHLRQVLSAWTGIPSERLGLSGNLNFDAAALRQILQARIFGQGAVIEALVAALARRLALPERDARRPLWGAMAAGPSGVGKTETARALAEYFFGDPRALIQIDCSELDQEHHLDRLVGSPPGYKGHGDGGQLTNALRRGRYCVILFDEVEKACDALLTKVLLPLLGDGVVHDMNSGQALDARDTVVFLTSNIGTNRREQHQVGFGAGQSADEEDGVQEREIRTAIGERLPKELLGRIDDVLIYRPLSDETLLLIWRRELRQFEQRLARRGDRVRVEINPEAEALLIGCSKVRASTQGARAVVSTFDKALVDRALRLLGSPSSVNRRLQVNHIAQGGLAFRIVVGGEDPEGGAQ